MTTFETDVLLLDHDPASRTARAVTISGDLKCGDGYAGELLFQGRRNTRFGYGLLFWDYVVVFNGDVVGVVLVGFAVEESLARSRLLTESTNVSRDRYGFHINLADTVETGEDDGAQEFGGSSLYMRDNDCLLLLRSLSLRTYAFGFDDGFTSPVPKSP